MAGTIGAVGLVAVLSACGSIYPDLTPTNQPFGGVRSNVREVTIGFAQQQVQAPYFAAMKQLADEIARKKGFKLLFQSANKDPAIQLNQMQAMLAQGASVLIVNATSVKGQVWNMKQIGSQVPVIYVDTAVPGTGTTAVQSNSFAIGQGAGKLAAERFKAMGKSQISMVVITGSPTDEFVGPARRKGFLQGLTDGGVKYTIESEQDGLYQQDTGQVAAETMLAAHPNVDLVMGLNDAMVLGAYNVVSGNPKYRNVYVAAAADGQREALALIKRDGCRGRYLSTGLNSPNLATEQALTIAIDIALGHKKPSDYPPNSYTLAVGIGCNNVDKFYDPNSVF
ncbi:sugar ABC transporter substrate-binding protein [Gordonia asplenii]|uniref:sugar ABC transporter substrate-binding protein n=1 Tax=Gordonia asplenii TaxID=2725283 RepID=UPI0028AD2F66|nr:sugar ABC transporter substrate-binding protein [Gordonia asplenii]